MFFDTHVHITLPEQKVLHHQLNIEEYVEILTNQQKGIGILFLNPFDDKYCCPNAFIDNQLHRSIVENISNKEYIIKCERCNTVHYRGGDVFRNDNIKLLELATNNKMYALAFLTAPNLSIQKQVDYYEYNYPEFLGYKIHSTISKFPADKLRINSKKTIVFHCGNDEYASPRKILKFAEKYQGNVIVAHFARFEKDALVEISEMSNVWVDMSPFTFLYNLIRTKKNQLCDTWGYTGEREDITNMFYEVAASVGYDKILFASDAPFGNIRKEIDFLENLNLSDENLLKIKEKNAKKAFRLVR